jgi:N-glycosylase/DNA lyase
MRPDAPVEEHMVVIPRGPYALVPTFSCGQIFRFTPTARGFAGACGDLAMHIEPNAKGLSIDFLVDSPGPSRIAEFLDLEHDVDEAARESLAFLQAQFPERSEVLQDVFAFSRGMHLLRQPVLETMVGYLLSVQSTVELVGKRLEALAMMFPCNQRVVDGCSLFIFPSADQLRSLTEESITGLRLGYRSRWLLEMLRRLPDERYFEDLRAAPPGERQEYFRHFAGIGPKVAACVDLFAYGNDSAFPIDVWVERGLRRILGMNSAEIARVRRDPVQLLGPHCGLFGEYLFRYERDGALPRTAAAPVTRNGASERRRSLDTAD